MNENSIRCYWLERTRDISIPQNNFAICCKVKPFDFEEGVGINDHSVITRIKQDFEEGVQAPECKFCWDDEVRGVESWRERYLNRLTVDADDFDIYELSIQVPSYCQGTCYYCQAPLSSSIGAFGKWVNGRTGDFEEVSVSNIEPKVSIERLIELANEIPADKPLFIMLVGGEPLIKDNVSDWLVPFLSEVSKDRTVSVGVTTNGWTKEEVVTEFYDFCDTNMIDVSVNISLENTGARAEWVRGCDWEQLEKVVAIHRQRASRMLLKCTENFLTVSNLPELVDWYHKMGFDTIDGGIVNQEYLSVDVLPYHFNKYTQEALRFTNDPEVIKFINGIEERLGTKSNLRQEAINYVHKIDTIRDTDFKAVFPEIVEEFENEITQTI